MKTPSDLAREHFPEFLKDLEVFKTEFGNIKREFVHLPKIGSFGKDLTGTAINPVISDKISKEVI